MFYSASTRGFYSKNLLTRYQTLNTWPEDAIELTPEEIEMFYQTPPPSGFELGADNNGRPTWVPAAQPPSNERRAQLKSNIDVAAGRARLRYVSTGQLVEEEYRLTLEQTKAWRSAGSPAESVPRAVQDWADAAGITAEDSATQIEQAAVAMETALLDIRGIRLAGKAAIDAAADTDDFDAIAQPYIDQLVAVTP